MQASAWLAATNLLCVRLDSLGDVLMTSPAIRALKESRPDRHITLLTSRSGAKGATLVPEIDELIVFDAPWMKHPPHDQDAALLTGLVNRLRARRFDAAVIFTVYTQSPLPAATVCFLAEIPRRLAHCRENPYLLLTDWVREIEPEQKVRHEVRRQLDLVAHVGCAVGNERLSLRTLPADRLRVLRLLHGLGVKTERAWLVIHPGASAPSRRYPCEHFAEVATALVRDQGWQVVFTGDEGERPLIEQIQLEAAVRSYSLAGRLRIGELAALLQLAPLLISNNSGPVHLAAGVGTPVVDLYALTNPQHTPWQVRSRVLSYDVPCRNCYQSVCPEGHHDCLRRVPPDAVVAAVLDLLTERIGDVHARNQRDLS